jgi:hypothetical protein
MRLLEKERVRTIINTGQSGTGGGGIWKSIDGGTSWNRLTSTIPDYTLILSPDASNRAMNEADSIKVGWREIYKVIVTSTGTVLALTNGGILKSEDKGNTWNRLKGTNAPLTFVANYQIGAISDMELGQDNVLYVAEGTNYSPQRILKSTDGTFNNYEVKNIPNNLFSNNEQGRVEIVLAKGTQAANQVIYAVSARSSLSKYAFFVKSVNGGAIWTKMTESTFKDDPVGGQPAPSVPFFDGQASYDLILGTHNTKPNVLYAGGVQFDMSFDGGSTWMDSVKNSNWRVMAAVMHSDHHAFEANPDNNDEAIFGNDGGVYYSNSWSATTNSLVGLGLQKRNKNYNVTQYYGVDFHPTANNGLVVGGAQDNGSHAISSPYNTIGTGVPISTGDGALTFIDQLDPNIVITSYTNISPNLHKTGATGFAPAITPKFSDKGKFINPAEYDSPAHTYYANFTYDAKAPVTGSADDTLAVRYKITTSTVPADEGYTYTPSYLTYPVNESVPPIKVSFLKLDKTTNATSNRVLYIGTSDGDVYKTTAFGIDGNQRVFLTKIMNKATTGTGNVSSIDFGTDNNTIIVTKSNYNIKSVYYSTNANGGINTIWTSKDEATHGLPNIPIRYALINPVDTKQVLLATDLGVWSTTDITATNPDWKETNETLAKVRCDMLKYRASDNTLIVGTHGRGIFSTQLNIGCTPPTAATAGSNSPVTEGSPINLTSSSTGGTSQSWLGSNGYTSTAQNPVIATLAAGVYNYMVTITSSGTCVATATTTVRVNSAPATCTPPTVTAGSNSPITVGGNIFLTATFPNSGIASWVGPNSYTSTGRAPIIAGATLAAAGVYTVTVASPSTSTCTVTLTVNVVVNPVATSCTPPTGATAGSNSPVTEGSPINLTSSSTGGTSQSWLGSNGYTSTAQNPVIATLAAGVYNYTVTITSSGTCVATATTSVLVNPVPTSSVVFVNVANTNATQNGNAWATAYSNMQTALSSAPANSVFWVAKGVYKPTATTNRNISFNIPSGAKLYGGFAGTETMLSEGNIEANPTILSGEIGSPSTVNDNSYHVVTFIGASNATILDGFTVMGGNASFNSTRPPSPTNVSASQPLSINDGGGIGLDNGSSPTIINCRIISNDAYFGGGLYATNNSNPTVKNSVFMNNQATFGGGIYNLSSNPTYSNILIAGNKATGGAMYNNGSNPIITNVTIAGNGGYNGAIFNSNSMPVIKNSILWGNISPFNDTQSIATYSIMEGGYLGVGNLNVNPQFINLIPHGLSPSLSGDYKLTNTSPAIDAGDNGVVGMTDTDLGNFPRRFNNGIVDIGAYEFQGSRMGGTVISIVSGNWETGATWNIGRKPLAGDTVIINNNHIVTVNNDGVMKSIEIRPNATLLYKTSGIKLQNGF